MFAHLRANLCLLVLSVLLCSVLYPLVLWGIGQTIFHDQAQGSLLTNAEGKPIGSRLIAQPFTADEYFPASPLGGLLQRRGLGGVELGRQQLSAPRPRGPPAWPDRQISQRPRPVAPDIETWFQKDHFGGKPGIVAQWATLHPTLAQNWVKADKLNAAYVADWQKAHPAQVAEWVKANPDTPEPKAEDLAVPFFADYAKAHPGTFPGAVEHKLPGGKTEKKIEPLKEGTDIQAAFFDMWIQEHQDADLQHVPADMVMASGSGLDPHITLDNALWQLDRVAAAWAKQTGGKEEKVHQDIEQLLRANSFAPLGGLFGVPLVNVLEVNVALRDRNKSR